MGDIDCGFRDLYEGHQAWTIEEFEAGYIARYREQLESVAATIGWRAGWVDADCELAAVGQANDPDRAIEAHVRLYGSGRLTRKCGLPFDPNAAAHWSPTGSGQILRLLALRRPNVICRFSEKRSSCCTILSGWDRTFAK